MSTEWFDCIDILGSRSKPENLLRFHLNLSLFLPWSFDSRSKIAFIIFSARSNSGSSGSIMLTMSITLASVTKKINLFVYFIFCDAFLCSLFAPLGFSSSPTFE